MSAFFLNVWKWFSQFCLCVKLTVGGWIYTEPLNPIIKDILQWNNIINKVNSKINNISNYKVKVKNSLIIKPRVKVINLSL